METKQVIVIRKDLKMRLGKSCSQAAHASMKVLLDTAYSNILYTRYTISLSSVNDPLYHWLKGAFTKVVVGCNSEEELLELYKKAKEERILCSLIQDAGRTEFHGEATYTAIAIGPDTPEKIDPITGHLKLL